MLNFFEVTFNKIPTEISEQALLTWQNLPRTQFTHIENTAEITNKINI